VSRKDFSVFIAVLKDGGPAYHGTGSVALARIGPAS
jgi:hypothetical protein